MENNIYIIYENDDFLVVNKPAGLIVHEGAGDTGPTLVDWFVDKYPEIKKFIQSHSEAKPKNLTGSFAVAQDDNNNYWPDPNRPGIVHRLDKDTSGVILLAKNPETLAFFQDQFRNRETEKTYLALALGKVEPKEGTIKGMIGRDQGNRQKQRSSIFSFSWDKGKTREAETDYKVLNVFDYNLKSITYHLSLLEVKPKTGRMHQIRVHLKQEGWPIIGDQVYNTKESKKISDKLDLHRQFLHAQKLKVHAPTGEKIGEWQEFESNLHEDLQNILNKLKRKKE